MSGDYLWNGNGPRDPDVVRLEQQLRRFGLTDPLPRLKALEGDSSPRASRVSALGWAASLAAAVIILATFVWRVGTTPAPGLPVTAIAGSPTVGLRPLDVARELTVGRWLETNADARARIAIGDIGQVEVDPDTRLGLLSTRPGDYRLHLARGTLHALIWAPPGQFAVETAASTAVDLGCAYTLNVDDEGVGHVRVTSGWVGFEWQGRESFIPAGAVCIARPGMGPGTPYYEDAAPELRAAVETIDFGAGPPATRAAALDDILAHARSRDVLTLWHLLRRVDADARDRVFDRLSEFVPAPDGVTREGIRAGRRDMLDRWWDHLGLGTAAWWRTWKQTWRDDQSRRQR